MRLFLDTNILIDKVARRMPHMEDVKILCAAKYCGDVELYISVQSYLDAIYILRNEMPAKELKMRCIDSLNLFEVVDTEKTSLLPALMCDWPDVEDFVIAQTAISVHAYFIITRDVKGFIDSSIKSLTPKEFINLLKTEYGVVYEID